MKQQDTYRDNRGALGSPLFLGVMLVCAVVAAYVPALGAGFVWDDPVLLTENPLMWLPGGLREIWSGTHMPDYIPLTLTGFWLEWRLWGADPAGYHLVNVLLHAVNALLFWQLLVRLGIPGAWLAALLFGIHPMNAASVAWVAERKNTLSLSLMLISAILYSRGIGLRELPVPDAERDAPLLSGPTAQPQRSLGQRPRTPDQHAFRAEGPFQRIPWGLKRAFSANASWFKDLGRCPRLLWGRAVGAKRQPATGMFIGSTAKDPAIHPTAIDHPGAFSKLKACLSRPALCYAAAVAAGVAAMLSKGTAVVLPGVLLLLEIWRRPNATRGEWARTVFRLLPLAIAAGAMAWVTLCFRSHALVAAHAPESVLFRVLRASRAVPFYVEKTLWPGGLAPIYPQGTLNMGSPASLSLAAMLLAVLLLARSSVAVRRGFAFGLGVFVTSLLPVLGLVARPAFFDQAPVADWWNYLPMLGICGLAGAGFQKFAARWRNPWPLWLSVGCAVALLGALTWRQASIYIDMETFCRAALARNPSAWIARNNLGLALAEHGQPDAAIEQYTLALRENPRCFEAHTNLAAVLADQGKFLEAEGHLREVLSALPNDPKARNNLGSVLFQMGRTGDAIAEIRASLDRFPYNPEALNNLGLALAATGAYEEALAQYQQALKLAPRNAGAWFNAGNAFAAQGRHELAVNALRNATRCAPAMASASQRLAQELLLLKRPAEAEAELLRLFNVNPRRAGEPALMETLAAARAAQGKAAVKKGAAAPTPRTH